MGYISADEPGKVILEIIFEHAVFGVFLSIEITEYFILIFVIDFFCVMSQRAKRAAVLTKGATLWSIDSFLLSVKFTHSIIHFLVSLTSRNFALLLLISLLMLQRESYIIFY